MKISVNKYTLEPDTVNGGTAGSHGLESLEFDFSPQWNELSRTVTFFPPKSVAKCVSFTGSTLPIPPEVTARAGKVAYVLCGAKDGTAVITLTGVINVSPTLTPTAADTEEHTPGALETATLLCAEARADAQTAAAAAESALGAEESVGRMAEEVQSARDVVCHLYDTVMDGTAVHADLTDANRYDRAHALSVAGLLGHLEDILSVISPFNIRVVENLPVDPDTTSMYVHDGTIKVYSTIQNSVVIHKWKSTY
ncbi:MAG: hypothetical protein IJ519_05970, partial [Clostridia bacterium]|nr:hypothetical protein [Clostridia bacterium]